MRKKEEKLFQNSFSVQRSLNLKEMLMTGSIFFQFGSRIQDPDPHQMDPKHCFKGTVAIFQVTLYLKGIVRGFTEVRKSFRENFGFFALICFENFCIVFRLHETCFILTNFSNIFVAEKSLSTIQSQLKSVNFQSSKQGYDIHSIDRIQL